MAFKLDLGDSSLAHSGHLLALLVGIQNLTGVFISQSWILGALAAGQDMGQVTADTGEVKGGSRERHCSSQVWS
jgi:hypothetical protein